MMEHPPERTAGFGLLEIVITVVLAGLLASVAVPAYNQHADRTKVSRALDDISSISAAIVEYRAQNDNALPASLADLETVIPVDPWGRPYLYSTIARPAEATVSFRKDKNLNSLNSDYDLYSLGEDGVSKASLSAPASRDDVVRANNGAFIGLGEDY